MTVSVNFKCISLSHKLASVDVREKFHLSDDQARRFSGQIKEILGLEELLLLSTCNRTEVYYISEEDRSEELVKLLCLEKGITHHWDYSPLFEVFTDHNLSVRRLFEVSMGLESAVIGDIQISNQIKQAYTIAHEMELAGPFLHRLLHTIFHANKRVHQETAYRDGAASVSYAASELAQELTAMYLAPAVLVIGLGEMGRDVALNIAQGKFSRVCLMNRTPQKAASLAQEIKAEWQPIEKLPEILGQFDVVVSAVAVEQPLFSPRLVASCSQGRSQFYIDLSVPRSVAPIVDEIPGVVVYDIDDIRSRTEETLRRRKEAVPAVLQIVSQEMDGFLDWSRELTISPTIQKLKDALEDIRREELDRFLKNADPREVELVEKVTKSIMNKIMKLPVLQLKAACRRGEEETLIGVLSDLFNLEGQQKKV